ncbi:MAG: NADPH-dependent oxidoreductase [Tissierellia bacterium]|nr:NADPH-dependent oxidoreductase [Tissierellia bacterium]
MSNDTIKKQLDHRTIREFKDVQVPDEVYKTLLDVAQRTPTSNGMQQSSIIRITDSKIKEELAKVCNQEYVARAPILLIFIVDNYRNHQIALEQGLDSENSGDMDRFFQGFTDGILAAQNIVNAAESMDLGAVFFGSILNDAGKIIELLELPEYTFPAVGLGIGYPNQEPMLKPRIDMDLRVFENKYEKMDNYLEKIADYDEKMQTYYDLRQSNKPLDKFSQQVVDRLKNPIPRRQILANDIVNQGFDLRLKK